MKVWRPPEEFMAYERAWTRAALGCSGLLLWTSSVVGCPSGGSSESTDAGRDASASARDAGTSTDAGSDPRDGAGNAADAGPSDPGSDAGRRDAGPRGSGTDAGRSITVTPGNPPPCVIDATATGTPSASSEYPDYPASYAVDDNLGLGWYGGEGSCIETSTPGIFDCTDPELWWRLDFPDNTLVSQVGLWSDRGYEGYDFLSAEVRFENATGDLIESIVVTQPEDHDAEPDYYVTLSPPLARVRRITVIIRGADAPESGIGELRVCSPR
jgi:hypothetical protein